MRDESLINIVNGADATDEEDIFLRASLLAALCELYSDKSAAAEPDAEDSVIENQGEPAVNDGEHDGMSTIVPFPRHRTALSRLHYGWAIAASLATVVVFGAGIMGSGKASERDDLLDEVAGYHEVYSRETTHLVEVPASQAEQLTAWLGERLDRDLKVPDLADAGLRFAGGRMLVVNDRPVAELMYTRAEGLPIAICISRVDGKPWSMDVEQHGALRIASWGKDGDAYIVVGELDDATVKDLARRVEAQI
jgi:anti-sigma factor RsiW